MPKADENSATWQDLDRRFRAPLRAYFYRRVQDRAEAEDLTQEVFVRLARHPDKHGEEGLDSYIFVIAANLLKDRGRHRTSRHTDGHKSLTDLTQFAAQPENLVEGVTPERVFVARETLTAVLASLDEMSERTRQIFILSRLEDMHYRDIAALYGISVSSVEKHMMRAIALLTTRFLKT